VESSRDVEAVGELVAATLGLEPSSIEGIAAGLGTRRFYRVLLPIDRAVAGMPASLIARVEASPEDGTSSPTGAVLDADLAWLPEPPLEPIRARLEAAGLPVPAAYGRTDRIDLIEDVGSDTLLGRAREAIGAGDGAESTTGLLRADYLEAADLIPRLQRVERGASTVEAFERHYDPTLIHTKTEKFLRWCWPGLIGRDATAEERDSIYAIRDALTKSLRGAPERLAHRDFKAENLHFWGERLVMIDVQGAFMAPPEYDLACLVFDLQVDLPDDLIDVVIAETLPRLPDRVPEAEARARLDALGVLRLVKDVAHVVHAARSRGDSRRWQEIPRGFELLDAASVRLSARFPELRALTNVIQTLSRGYDAADIEHS